MGQRERLSRIAARRRVEQQRAANRSRWVDWAQVAAVALAGIGLVLGGYSGILQYRATQDQLRQSEEARKREREQLASLFEVRLGSKEKGADVIMTNYSRHSFHFVTTLLTTPDGRKWVVQATSVGPCTTKKIPLEKLKKWNSEFNLEYAGKVEDGWEAAIRMQRAFFYDYGGRTWEVVPLRSVPRSAIDRAIDTGGYQWVTLEGAVMDGLTKDAPIPDCSGSAG